DGSQSYRSGFDTGKRVIAPFLWGKKIRRIDYLVSTHSRLGNRGGLNFIAENFIIKKVWLCDTFAESHTYKDLSTKRNKKGMHTILLHSGFTRDIEGVKVEVLLHNVPCSEGYRNVQNFFLALKLSYHDVSFLFVNHNKSCIEELFALDKAVLRGNVLQVSCSDSTPASNAFLIRSVNPEVVVLATDDKNYHQKISSCDIIEACERSGCEVLRTDRNGAITTITNGKQLWVKSFK
ncbi:MAG: hypothetical protein SVW57_11060, partial [Thermodesulfobacteriota bacterium]|nr:hypothetical protein [Thermodesulfobacteriota bacterium]